MSTSNMYSPPKSPKSLRKMSVPASPGSKYPLSEIGPLLSADDLAQKTFEAVKEEVLKKIWDLHEKDVVHNLNAVWKLENIESYDVISYRVEDVPHGVNYYAKIQMTTKEDCVHVRVFRPAEGKGPVKFHAVQTRSSEEGGAVFTLEDALRPFEY